MSAEILVHALLDVAHQLNGKLTIALGHHHHPAVGELFVVEQDEEGVDDNHCQGEHAGEDVDGLGYYRPYLGNSLLDGVHNALLGNDFLDVVGSEVLMDELFHHVGDVAHKGIPGHIGNQ